MTQMTRMKMLISKRPEGWRLYSILLYIFNEPLYKKVGDYHELFF